MTWPIPSNMANITFLSWWPSKYMAYIHIHQDTAFEELDHYGDKWNIYTHSWSDVFLTKQKKHGPGRPNTQSPVIKLIVVNTNQRPGQFSVLWFSVEFLLRIVIWASSSLFLKLRYLHTSMHIPRYIHVPYISLSDINAGVVRHAPLRI